MKRVGPSRGAFRRETAASSSAVAGKAHSPPADRGALPRKAEFRALPFLGLVVATAVLWAHWPALSAKALSFDDNQYLTENLLVQNPSWDSAQRFLSEVLEPSTVAGYYQPLTMISLMLDCAMEGSPSNLRPFHRTSLALHVANTLLLMLLLWMLVGQPWAAAMVALLYGVHPMTVEPVPWVGERKTLLAAFFVLGSLMGYVQYVRSARWSWYLGSVVLFVLALLSKPTSTPLPGLLVLLDIWPLRRLSFRPIAAAARRAILEKLPFLLLAVLFAWITFESQARTAKVLMPSEYQQGSIPLILCHNIVFYLHKIILPVNLTSHYPVPEPFGIGHPKVLAGVLGTILLAIVLLVSLRRTPAVAVGWLFFFIAIFPTMGIIGFTNVLTSDKYAYLPALGLLMPFAAGMAGLWARRPAWRPLGRGGLVAVVLMVAAAEAAGTRRQLGHWQDTVGYCRYMLQFAPHQPGIHKNVSIELMNRRDYQASLYHSRKVIELTPDDPEGYYNLGNVYVQMRDFPAAIQNYREALKRRENYAVAHNNLANALRETGRFDEAITEYHQALNLKPSNYQAHANLGFTLEDTGRLDEAIPHYRRALEINPREGIIHCALGNALGRKGQFDEGIRHYLRAMELKPGDPTARHGLELLQKAKAAPAQRDAQSRPAAGSP